MLHRGVKRRDRITDHASLWRELDRLDTVPRELRGERSGGRHWGEIFLQPEVAGGGATGEPEVGELDGDRLVVAHAVEEGRGDGPIGL